MASHVHCRQRVDFGDGLFGGVGQLVFDVAVVALLGLERGHPVARLLDLAREGHDREELGLRLGQRLAGPDGRQVEALHVGVHGVRGAAPFGDRLDDSGRTDPDVAGGEDARPPGLEGDRVGLEPVLLGRLDPIRAGADPGQVGTLADGQQDAVAGDREFGAGVGLRAAPAGRIGRARCDCG